MLKGETNSAGYQTNSAGFRGVRRDKFGGYQTNSADSRDAHEGHYSLPADVHPVKSPSLPLRVPTAVLVASSPLP